MLQQQKYIFVFTNSVVKTQHAIFPNKSFLGKVLVSLFSFNITLYIEKNPEEKLCKVLEIEFKTYSPTQSKIRFRENQI